MRLLWAMAAGALAGLLARRARAQPRVAHAGEGIAAHKLCIRPVVVKVGIQIASGRPAQAWIGPSATPDSWCNVAHAGQEEGGGTCCRLCWKPEDGRDEGRLVRPCKCSCPIHLRCLRHNQEIAVCPNRCPTCWRCYAVHPILFSRGPAST